jgi:hypothetical protein
VAPPPTSPPLQVVLLERLKRDFVLVVEDGSGGAVRYRVVSDVFDGLDIGGGGGGVDDSLSVDLDRLAADATGAVVRPRGVTGVAHVGGALGRLEVAPEGAAAVRRGERGRERG